MNIEKFIDGQREWILKNIAHKDRKIPTPILKPESINLLALNEHWQVDYQQTDISFIRLFIHSLDKKIILNGAVDDADYCSRALIQWFKPIAKKYLAEQIKIITKDTGLKYSKVTTRFQTTRWGSCSREKSINLNAKLLFLPKALVRHVIIHELCHTVHLNHSQRFWDLVAKP